MAVEASGAAFELVRIDLFAGEARRPAFLQLNPFGTVPVLEDGAMRIPETGAILLHVAEKFPACGLLPRRGAERTEALRWLFHVAALHADFMTWRRAGFAIREAERPVVQDWMTARLESAFRVIDGAMTGPYLAGARPTVGDLYLLMVAGWWRKRFAFAERTPRLAAGLSALAAVEYVGAAYAAQGSERPDFGGAHTV